MKFDIFKNGEKINCIVSDKGFCEKYCADNGYTYSEVIDEHKTHAEEVIYTREDEIDAILIEQEYRLTLLELGVSA